MLCIQAMVAWYKPFVPLRKEQGRPSPPHSPPPGISGDLPLQLNSQTLLQMVECTKGCSRTNWGNEPCMGQLAVEEMTRSGCSISRSTRPGTI
jgi:hypothetical protein